MPTERKLAAILSADVVSYSRLISEDEEATVRTLNAYREEVAGLIREHRGRLADFSGDNFLAEFPTALDAMRCALEIQSALGARNADLPPERRLEFRIGAHLGDVRVEDDRLYGDGVNIAARLEGLAEPGGVVISRTVQEQVVRRLDVGYEDLGERTLKNIPETVRAYRVQPEGGSWWSSVGVPVRRRLAAGLAVAIAGGAVAWGWTLFPSGFPGAGATPSILALAVLPLENLSGDPEQEYFSDGMTEALIADLAKIGALRVISRTSVMKYKGARKPLPEIARDLGVATVIEGSVFRAGDSVRITVQLIDARNDQHLWSKSYERDLRDVLAMQAEVARAIAEEVELELTPRDYARLAAQGRVDPRAHDAFLRAAYFYNQGGPDGLKKANRYCEEAIRIDPGYAPAYALLASTFS